MALLRRFGGKGGYAQETEFQFVQRICLDRRKKKMWEKFNDYYVANGNCCQCHSRDYLKKILNVKMNTKTQLRLSLERSQSCFSFFYKYEASVRTLKKINTQLADMMKERNEKLDEKFMLVWKESKFEDLKDDRKIWTMAFDEHSPSTEVSKRDNILRLCRDKKIWTTKPFKKIVGFVNEFFGENHKEMSATDLDKTVNRLAADVFKKLLENEHVYVESEAPNTKSKLDWNIVAAKKEKGQKGTYKLDQKSGELKFDSITNTGEVRALFLLVARFIRLADPYSVLAKRQIDSLMYGPENKSYFSGIISAVMLMYLPLWDPSDSSSGAFFKRVESQFLEEFRPFNSPQNLMKKYINNKP